MTCYFSYTVHYTSNKICNQFILQAAHNETFAVLQDLHSKRKSTIGKMQHLYTYALLHINAIIQNFCFLQHGTYEKD